MRKSDIKKPCIFSNTYSQMVLYVCGCKFLFPDLIFREIDPQPAMCEWTLGVPFTTHGNRIFRQIVINVNFTNFFSYNVLLENIIDEFANIHYVPNNEPCIFSKTYESL